MHTIMLHVTSIGFEFWCYIYNLLFVALQIHKIPPVWNSTDPQWKHSVVCHPWLVVVVVPSLYHHAKYSWILWDTGKETLDHPEELNEQSLIHRFQSYAQECNPSWGHKGMSCLQTSYHWWASIDAERILLEVLLHLYLPHHANSTRNSYCSHWRLWSAFL